jgi:hypothetical protein
MEPSSGRFMPVLLALVVGVGIGWLVFRPQGTPVPEPQPAATPAPTRPAPTPTCVPWSSQGKKSVLVGPTVDDVYPECLTIHASTDTITWVYWDSNKSLGIAFPAPSPFKVTCSGPQCGSGRVILPPYPAGTKKTYTYTQSLTSASGVQEKADGRIIIEW